MANNLNDQLTPTNFVQKIKDMDNRDRSKLKADTLIKLIIQLDETAANNQVLKQINELSSIINKVQQNTLENAKELKDLREENLARAEENKVLEEKLKVIAEENDVLRSQVDGIDTYLRVNNLEINGLDSPLPSEINGGNTESTEEMVLKCLNGLFEDDFRLTSDDIDICHELPSKNNRQPSHVVKFVSRKAKNIVLDNKKQRRNYNFKFRNKNIFINEHLTPKNKNIYSIAKQKKQSGDYKFLWTRNGKIYLRKDDNSQVVHVTDVEMLSQL